MLVRRFAQHAVLAREQHWISSRCSVSDDQVTCSEVPVELGCFGEFAVVGDAIGGQATVTGFADEEQFLVRRQVEFPWDVADMATSDQAEFAYRVDVEGEDAVLFTHEIADRDEQTFSIVSDHKIGRMQAALALDER